MTASEAVRLRLLGITAVTALVGTRVYNVKLPHSPTFPAIRVQRIGEQEFMHLRGGVKIYRSRVQIDSVSREASGVDVYAQATGIDEALWGDGDATALKGWSGTVGTSPNTCTITGILPADLREGYDALELNQFKVMRDAIVWHTGN